jgi:predicted permease
MSNEVRPRWLQEKTPPVVSRTLVAIRNGIIRLAKVFWDFMNPPLWAMLAAIIVASIPALQRLFFTKGTFIQNSVTRAVTQSGNVAVPLILVVLGANLAGNTQPKTTASANKHDTKILIASLLSRMVLPFVFMAPLLAVATKYFGISILDDPIFLIVCFLLTGAPSALQLAQICQINGVYETVMARVLFWSYVIVILPSTLILVVTAIEVVHWAT